MRYKRILLVSPPSSSYLGAARPPQNLGYLARALLDRHIEYDILDMRLGYGEKDLDRKISAFGPDLIGVTMVSLEYIRTYRMIERIRDNHPEISVVAGGPHVSVLRQQVLEECSAIDYGVLHEGEKSLVALCEGNDNIERIPDLLWRRGDDIAVNPPSALDRMLDDIAFPTYEKFELEKYIREMPFNSSRGCPYQCVFCPNKMMTGQFRWRSAGHVVDEIEYWYGRGYRIFNYDDDNFTLRNDRVYEICDEIERRGIREAEFRCSNGVRADRVDEALLRRMKEVGFHYIAFGVDGGNDRMLRINKKGETLAQIENAIHAACGLGYDVKIFVITCMPYETEQDVEDSLRLVQKYPVQRVILNNPIPYPGTELFDIVRTNGWFIKQPEDYLNHVTENENEPVFETPELSREDRVRIIRKCRKIEKKVTREAVQRMYRRFRPLNRLAGYLFATDWMQHLFFENMAFRRSIEKIRHRRMLRHQQSVAS